MVTPPACVIVRALYCGHTSALPIVLIETSVVSLAAFVAVAFATSVAGVVAALTSWKSQPSFHAGSEVGGVSRFVGRQRFGEPFVSLYA